MNGKMLKIGKCFRPELEITHKQELWKEFSIYLELIIYSQYKIIIYRIIFYYYVHTKWNLNRSHAVIVWELLPVSLIPLSSESGKHPYLMQNW